MPRALLPISRAPARKHIHTALFWRTPAPKCHARVPPCLASRHVSAQAGAEANPRTPAEAKKKEEIDQALRAKREGDSQQYNAIVAQLRRDDGVAELTGVLTALTYCVSSISDQFEDLIASALSIAWHRDAELASAFTTFICHLVSANGVYIEMCLRVLVERMLPGACAQPTTS